MSILLSEFDWDEGNWPKCAKHGVSKAEIEHVIVNSRFFVEVMCASEKRYRTFGQTPQSRYVFVAFVIRVKRGKLCLRPVSARYMHQKEINAYEKAMAEFQNG